MAKKKMSKKTKYTLLGIGLVAVGAGYFIAKHFKSSVAGIGAVTRKTKRSRKPAKQKYFFEINTVDFRDGTLVPLWDPHDLYRDWNKAQKYLNDELKKEGLRISRFFADEENDLWVFEADDYSKFYR